MFSSQGLETWELIFVSGMLAASMLVISAVIGWAVAHVVLRESVPVATPIAQADPVRAESAPEPAYAGGNRGLAVSSH
jgi:hypothetical protein